MAIERNLNDHLNDETWENTFAELARRSNLQRLPAEAHAQLLRAFRQHKAANRPPMLWQRLVAVVTYDSAAALLPAGARTTRLSEGRQLVYETERGDIALDVQISAETAAINGQLFLAESDQPHLVQLLRGEQEVVSAVSDELGEFSFVDVAPGSYQLIAVGGDYELVVDTLALGDTRQDV